jgi:hypothetical protein
MQLFELDKDWNLRVQDAAWGLLPFKKTLKRDKSRTKERALKEMLFIYYYSDIKSDYLTISDPLEREHEIIKDIKLPDDWKIDNVMKEAIEFYEERSLTVIGKLYKNTLKAVDDISEYLTMTDTLLRERDKNDKPVTDISKITSAVKHVKSLMQDLKAAEKEVIKEQQELEGRKKGSRELSIFEEGLTID